MTTKNIKPIIQIVITAVLLLFSMWLIFYEPETSNKLKWAYGIIGIIIGYWLK